MLEEGRNDRPLDWCRQIRRLRKHLGLTQAEFANRLGDVSEATVNRWERGSTPQGKHWQALLSLANESDFLRTFTGVSIRNVYLAKFRNQEYLPSVGSLAFLSAFTNRPGDYRLILELIWECGGRIKRSATVDGQAAEEDLPSDLVEAKGKHLVFVLFTLPSHEMTMEFRRKIAAMECLSELVFKVRFASEENDFSDFSTDSTSTIEKSLFQERGPTLR